MTMKKAAVMKYEKRQVIVKILDEKLGHTEETIYGWKTRDGKWIRIGTSKAPLRSRLLVYAKHINKALRGEKTYTSPEEGRRWRKLLKDGNLYAFATQPREVKTYAGKVRPYLDIERILIAKHKPELNRGFR